MESTPSHQTTNDLGMGTGNYEVMSRDHPCTTSLQSFRSYGQEKAPCQAVRQYWIQAGCCQVMAADFEVEKRWLCGVMM